ncbi:hypothetical protein [Cohnella sp. 56]|uniref:hypothetical protein n=1 Tax=Cohnella sp. 56 TaxID=3113722 RepID=UPI0030EAABB2
MAMAMYKTCVIANACITRYNGGEREIEDIVGSYNLSAEDRDLVEAEIYAKRPDIKIGENDSDDMGIGN